MQFRFFQFQLLLKFLDAFHGHTVCIIVLSDLPGLELTLIPGDVCLQPQCLDLFPMRDYLLIEAHVLAIQVFYLFLQLALVDSVYCLLPLFLHLGQSLLIAGNLLLELSIFDEQLVLLRHLFILL